MPSGGRSAETESARRSLECCHRALDLAGEPALEAAIGEPNILEQDELAEPALDARAGQISVADRRRLLSGCHIRQLGGSWLRTSRMNRP